MTTVADFILKEYNPQHIFFDFDGVIKDSVEIKGLCFKKLFEDCSDDCLRFIDAHHLSNGGVSRFQKIPLYMNYAGLSVNSVSLSKFYSKFAELSIEAVINSPWVPGARESLIQLASHVTISIVTATDDKDMITILKALSIDSLFCSVYGSSSSKHISIDKHLKLFNLNPDKCLFIGDSLTDLMASQKTNVPFVLRKTSVTRDDLYLNGNSIYSFADFLNG